MFAPDLPDLPLPPIYRATAPPHLRLRYAPTFCACRYAQYALLPPHTALHACHTAPAALLHCYPRSRRRLCAGSLTTGPYLLPPVFIHLLLPFLHLSPHFRAPAWRTPYVPPATCARTHTCLLPFLYRLTTYFLYACHACLPSSGPCRATTRACHLTSLPACIPILVRFVTRSLWTPHHPAHPCPHHHPPTLLPHFILTLPVSSSLATMNLFDIVFEHYIPRITFFLPGLHGSVATCCVPARNVWRMTSPLTYYTIIAEMQAVKCVPGIMLLYPM